jgi:hypothetical protein
MPDKANTIFLTCKVTEIFFVSKICNGFETQLMKTTKCVHIVSNWQVTGIPTVYENHIRSGEIA